jgi:LAO/AO transport system kinase
MEEGRSASGLVDRIRAGDPRGLGRALTLVERGGEAAAALGDAFLADQTETLVAGFTGPPGAGKSTLLAAIAGVLRAREERVAVLSVDPSSRFTNGALLGDRIRFAEHFLDDGVFVRSMATRGVYGGLAAAVVPAIAVLGAAAFPRVLVETVGVGQNEVDVVDVVDLVVLVLMPGGGDAVQALKAGVMEVPDVIVVNKADDPRAEATAVELRRTLRSGPTNRRPVLLTNSLTGEGVGELVGVIDDCFEEQRESGELRHRRRARRERETVRMALALASDAVWRAIAEDEEGRRLRQEVVDGVIGPADAGRRLLGVTCRLYSVTTGNGSSEESSG